MKHRFFSDQPLEGSEVVLAGAEAHHLVNVLRASPGAEVILFDGSGCEFAARVRRIDRQSVALELVERREANRESVQRCVLGVALPKGDRRRMLVEKCVELGVHSLVPLATERGVAQPGETARDRLERTVIESSKQCGRNRLMALEPPQQLDTFLTSAPSDAIRWIAHPGGSSIATRAAAGTPLVYIAVGPEGGFTASELSCAREVGWTQVDLGPRTLRVETAAIVLAAHWLMLRRRSDR
jgi:16S rRNA (uracil1498-N3)-methyltransferase